MRVLREKKSFLTIAVAAILFSMSANVKAQEEADEEKLPDTPAIKAFNDAKAKIDKASEAIEALFAKARTLTRQDKEEIEKLQADYTVKLAVLKKELKAMKSTGLAALKDAPKSKKIGDMMLQIAIGDIQEDRYGSAYKLLTGLISSMNGADGLNDAAAMAAFGMNNFEAAKKHLKAAIDNKETQRLSGRLSDDTLDGHIADWKKEQAIRAKEAVKNDLPRVKFETTAGDIVIELYENEAPQAVGNFVSLVEKKFYDGLVFHRVLPGFMAQGGCPEGRGSGGPGYNIYCECHKENYRKHFAGTLSMAHAGRDTGGSQFFLTFLPTPHLDGRHTAFGRVVEGMDVLGDLKRVDPRRPSGVEPSKIKKATVIRKRDHEYKPTKVE